MTRQYQIQKITGKPDWNKIEKAPIDQKLWLPCEQVSAYAQLAYDDSRLYVRLHAEEPTIRAENTGILDQPCQDSCLEFFFSAAEQDARYINIELNPSLCIYFGFGTGREDLMRILLPDGAKTLHAASERTPSGWDVTYELPFQLLRLFFPDFAPSGTIRGNFYKCGSIPIDEGKILIGNEDITHMPEHKRHRRIGRVYQDPARGTCPSMTILENMSMADNKGKRFGLGFGVNRKRIDFYRSELASLGLGLEDKLDVKMGALSGGQRQAVALLMATMTPLNFLILDEHTAALDPKTADKVLQITEEIVARDKLTTLMVTHNMKHAIQYGNRLIMMDAGKVVVDIRGEEKKNLSVRDLLEKFKIDNDRMLLSE